MKGVIHKQRVQIPQKSKIRAILQRDIASKCPICNSTEVGHFEIHHIDEDRNNNDLANLVLLCPTCHSKVTKGDISKEKIKKTKVALLNNQNVELASITASPGCGWITSENLSNAFFIDDHAIQKLPVLNFSFINHSGRTLLLKAIKLEAKHLPRGISGIDNPVRVLRPIASYSLQIPPPGRKVTQNIKEEVVVPSNEAFKVQLHLHEGDIQNSTDIQGRKVLNFTFDFSSNINISKKVFLNCENENEGFIIKLFD